MAKLEVQEQNRWVHMGCTTYAVNHNLKAVQNCWQQEIYERFLLQVVASGLQFYLLRQGDENTSISPR